jgi:hypothetical protein
MRHLSLMFILLALPSLNLLALTTAELRVDCEAETRLNSKQTQPGDAILAGICVGYIEGIVESTATPDFCPTKPMVPGTAVGAVKAFLAGNPKKMAAWPQKPL